jgi:hypothetical protein
MDRYACGHAPGTAIRQPRGLHSRFFCFEEKEGIAKTAGLGVGSGKPHACLLSIMIP